MLKSVPFSQKGSSKKQIDIRSISNGILELPENRYRLVLAVNSVNFELRSEEEQDALIDTYESFLNSIGFYIQILVRTREIDMDSYLESIGDQIIAERDSIYKRQLENYRQFIASLIKANKILSRQFYIVVPFNQSKSKDRFMVNEQLRLRADIITKNLSRLGIGARELSSIEIIDLFYSFYSPEQSKLQPISEKALEVIDKEFVTKGRSHDKG